MAVAVADAYTSMVRVWVIKVLAVLVVADKE
jgi:hypothetical protein